MACEKETIHPPYESLATGFQETIFRFYRYLNLMRQLIQFLMRKMVA